MIQLTSKNEVAEFSEADQFPSGKSQFMCGYFACYIAASMAQPGNTPKLTPAQIISNAEAAYTQDSGGDSISVIDGMTNEEEYALLQAIGLHYQAIATDISQVKAWIAAGYPVLLGVTETSVFDLALSKNPYPWSPAGTHVILATGVTSDGNILVRDSANCTNLYDPGSLRPGPRTYKPTLQLVSATVVVPPWLPRPTSANAPTGGNMQVPSGWKDDSGQKILTAPNGVTVSQGFRDYILNNNWDADDIPLRVEYHVDQVLLHNMTVGSGQRLLCKKSYLWYTDSAGVKKEPYIPWELDAAYQQIVTQQGQIASLKLQLAQSQPVNTTDLVTQLRTILTAGQTAMKELGQ